MWFKLITFLSDILKSTFIFFKNTLPTVLDLLHQTGHYKVTLNLHFCFLWGNQILLLIFPPLPDVIDFRNVEYICNSQVNT